MEADCGALLRNIRWVMDNMKSHHAKAVKNLLDSSEIRYIYLPPYSPDLNITILRYFGANTTWY